MTDLGHRFAFWLSLQILFYLLCAIALDFL